MPRKRYSTEHNGTKLRQAAVELGRGLRTPQGWLCCVLCAKALEQKERSWHKVACRSRPTHKGVTP